MTTPPVRPRKRWLRITLAVLAVAVIGAAATVVYVVRSTPQYRTAFLVDTSDAQRDFGALADSVGAAVRNTGDGDALSLRRFGGDCGDSGNTEELVGSGRGNGKRIGEAAHTLTPGGKATLNSGLLAAIDDFSGRYPFRGSKRNRIVVVTTQGTDGCGEDPAAMNKRVRDRMDALGLQLEFRFVGYRVPVKEQEALTTLASVTRSATPQFTQDAAELNAVLEKLVIPTLPEAKPVELPAQEVPVTTCTVDGTTPQPMPPVRLPSQVKLPAGAQVYGAAPDRHVIAPAGKACDLTTYESSGGLQLIVSDHPSAMEGYGVGLGESETADTGEAVDIPTGVPGLSIGTIRDTSGPEIKAWLRVLRTDKRPATSNLLCLLPKEQADICTASLVFFFLRQTAGTNISTADRDRVTAALEAYVKSLP
ncbi:hypothetical protein ACIA98_28425 [Streptomyces sp. NPDC051366]|uniref:hypothetical protein n=1 Tax=Streptomyces sp. NPDC051366 TaxID=3365652 RepID=UPI00378D6319